MRIKGIHYVRFAVGDLGRQEDFASDFGLIPVEHSGERLIMRTCGGDSFAYLAQRSDSNRFIGRAFEVEDEASLDEALAKAGANDGGALDLPGGGRGVSLTDPDGNEVLLIHGNARRGVEQAYPELVHNTPFRKERFGRNQHPREIGPARPWRLGHVGLFVQSFGAAGTTRMRSSTTGIAASMPSWTSRRRTAGATCASPT